MKFFSRNKKKINSNKFVYFDKFMGDITELGFVYYKTHLNKDFYKHKIYDHHRIIISTTNVTGHIYIMYFYKIDQIHSVSIPKKVDIYDSYKTMIDRIMTSSDFNRRKKIEKIMKKIR